jgi:hypothetical protein
MKRFSLTITILVSALQLSAQTNANTRVALVSDSGDAQVANVLDLATATLGQEKGIELLDRAAIARVLAEQNLSLSGAVNANSVVSAGKLLSVDLFAVIDSVTQTNEASGKAGRTVAGLVVFDAKTGVRLWDATLSADGDEKLAESIADGVLTAQRKQIAAGLPTICLMSVRNADLPRSLDSLCDSVGLLLERRLTASLGCVVLERERLDEVNKERSLPAGAEQQQLLASLVMMELECSRGPDGKGMSASARLTDNSGKVLDAFSVTNDNANADELAAALHQKISEVMKLEPGAATEDRSKESDRFRQESSFFFSHGDWKHGLQDLEAAFALKPDDNSLREELAGTLVSLAGTQTNLLQSLRIADRGTDLFLKCARESRGTITPNSRRGAYDFTRWFFEPECQLYMGSFNGNTFKNANYLSQAEMEETRQLVSSIYEKYRSFRGDIALPALFQAILNHPDDQILENRDLFHDYGFYMLSGMWSTENISALYPEDFSRDWLATLKGYLNLLEQAPLENHPRRINEVKFTLYAMVLSHKKNNGASGPSDVNKADREEAWRLMATHPCPLVRAFGKLDELSVAQDEAARKKETLPPVGQTYRLYLQDCIADLTQSTNTNSRRLLYEATEINDFFDPLGGDETMKLCDFMLLQNDLDPKILNEATSYLLSQTNKESAGRAVEFYDRAAALLQQPNIRYFGGSDTNQYLEDLSKQRALAQKKFAGITEPPLPPLPPAWREARQLIDLAGATKGLTQIFRPVVQGDFVYAAGFGTDETDGGQFLQLLRISLKSGAVSELRRIAITNVGPSVACADKNNYYLGTSQGIYIFPKSGGPVERLNQSNGLPSDEVTALDCLDGKLYIGLGESGYLVSYDLTNRQCEVLCSARRREQLSPFDNGSPLGISIIVADALKHRIVFLADQGGGGGDWWSDLELAQQTKADVFQMICAKARAGIWSYNPASREFKCILPRHPNAGGSDYLIQVRRVSDTQIAIAGAWGAAQFDFKTDNPTLLYGKCYSIGLEEGMESMVQSRGMKVNPALHYAPLLDHSPGDLRSGIFFVHDGWVWNAGRFGDISFSRVSMDSNRKQDFPPLRPDDKNFVPAECFRLVGPDQALIGDQHGLWLVTFADDDAKTKSRQR